MIRVTKDGCAPVDIALRRTVSGWIAGDAIWANPLAGQGANSAEEAHAQFLVQIGVVTPLAFLVDFLDGAAYKLPKQVHASLCR